MLILLAMALNIKDDRADRLVRELAAETGESLTAAVTVAARRGAEGVGDLDAVLAALAVRTVAFDAAQASIARAAFTRFGKGRSRAGLNYGDCFSYALAQTMGRPLLFKGENFGPTGIMPAAPGPSS